MGLIPGFTPPTSPTGIGLDSEPRCSYPIVWGGVWPPMRGPSMGGLGRGVPETAVWTPSPGGAGSSKGVDLVLIADC
eukprot:1183338-Prorocentrum_minimum.AAC.3